MWKATSGGTAMPETPSLDPRRTGDPVATTDEPLAVPDCTGGLCTPAGASNRAARYLLGEEIARGGMGVVYRATDRVLGRQVVVKVLQSGAQPPDGLDRAGHTHVRGWRPHAEQAARSGCCRWPYPRTRSARSLSPWSRGQPEAPWTAGARRFTT